LGSEEKKKGGERAIPVPLLSEPSDMWGGRGGGKGGHSPFEIIQKESGGAVGNHGERGGGSSQTRVKKIQRVFLEAHLLQKKGWGVKTERKKRGGA